MDNGVVDFLRDRAEENLNDVLKTSMGGYTKKSVQDYVAQLRKQQQAASRRFDEEMKNMLSEKESLAEELKRAKNRLVEREAQYIALSESLREYKQADVENQIENMVELKGQLAKQENIIANLKTEKQVLKKKQDQAEAIADEAKRDFEQLSQEFSLTRELLSDEQKKNLENLKQIQELSSQHTIDQNELDFLRKQTSEGALAQLKEKIETLRTRLEEQQGILEQRGEEIELKNQQIQSQAHENDMKEKQIVMLKEKTEKLQQTVELITNQNMRLEAYQKELIEQLQKSFQEKLAVLNSKAELRLENQKMLKQLQGKDLSVEFSDDTV